MISSIQVSDKLKKTLNNFRASPKESYEQIILKLINEIENQKSDYEKRLIEECQAISDESLRITKDFESIEDLDNWKW